jgi:putative ABC transport system ATP-binding protein
VALVAALTGRRNGEARQRAESMLARSGLSERLGFLPEKLSGGEQRVAIARALVNDPTILFADEPTANLDSKIGHEIMRLLRSIAKEQGRSVVIVSHDHRIKDIADRVLRLEDGQFKEMTAMASDLVCGMAVAQEAAAGTMEYPGVSYYFCAKGCLQEFAAEPNRFAGG